LKKIVNKKDWQEDMVSIRLESMLGLVLGTNNRGMESDWKF
jgi:hypothetical protein